MNLRDEVEDLREAGRTLARYSHDERNTMLRIMSHQLRTSAVAILAANEADFKNFDSKEQQSSLAQRLKLDHKKLETLCQGIEAIAAMPDPLHRCARRTLLADGLLLEQCTAALGVVLVIFESRPDVLS